MASDNRLGETSAEVLAGKLVKEGVTQGNNQLESTLSEYQDLFELIPCIVTVQDRNYRLLRFNREFGEKFAPALGDYCYNAYKGRSEKCPVCPVEKTFEDGQSHWSEEKGLNKDGTEAYWVVKTAPIKNAKGEIIAAIEMCLDITYRKELEQRLKITKALEQRLKITEKKYQAIFNNIPNSVFVIDADTLDIFDCNESVKLVYGYSPEEVVGKSFLDLFRSEQREYYASKLRKFVAIDQARHFTKDGRTIFVGIGVSPSEFFGKTVLIVTTNDITRRLETEQQLIQASKMATLGEMATGVAHELNQPLSVIKTASSFFIRKINRKERIDDDVFLNIANKISGNIDRATRIINHMREFGRKSEMDLGKVRVNEVLKRAHEVLSQQLRLRGIEVVFSLEENLPEVMAGPSRLEQVFINLLVNARDAIEEKLETVKERTGEEKIIIKTSSEGKTVTVQVTDSGHGIPETILNKIFEPFFTTKQPGKGTGLGLSISYGIIKDFGGSIYALSSGDKGATFVIKLPVPNEG